MKMIYKEEEKGNTGDAIHNKTGKIVHRFNLTSLFKGVRKPL